MNLDRFLNEKQDPKIVEKVSENVSQILTQDEEVRYIAVQKKLVMNVAPICVVLTNRRFIIYKPGILRKVDFEDYIWRNLKDAHLKEGFRGATLTMTTIDGHKIQVEDLPKAQARRLYSLAQELEVNAFEERRERELEEARAKAGGVVVHGSNTASHEQPKTQDDIIQKLSQLKKMADSGLITEEEFQSKKADILSEM